MYITMTIMILSQIISIFNDSRHLWGARCALFPGVHVHSVWKIAISEKLNQFFSEMIAHYLLCDKKTEYFGVDFYSHCSLLYFFPIT